jgi:hypothetical protein
MEEVDANPPKPNGFEIKWGNPEKLAAALSRKYSKEK